MRRHARTGMAAVMAAGSMALAAGTPPPLQPLDGGEAAAVQAGELAWADRSYRLTEWPEPLRGLPFVRSSIRAARSEVRRAGFAIVVTPAGGEKSLAPNLRQAGFQRVDIPAFFPYTVGPNRHGNLCLAFQKAVAPGEIVAIGYYGLTCWREQAFPIKEGGPMVPGMAIPTVDISGETGRHSFVARGTEEVYQGHVDTVLMPDGKTLFAAWAINHAGFLGPVARSDDAGLTWSAPLPTPDNWREVTTTTPTIHRLPDPGGVERLFVFGGRNFPGRISQSVSVDGGRTWAPMADTGLVGECPPKSILPFAGGQRLLMWCDRRDPANAHDPSPVVWQSESRDGGLTWGPEQVIFHVPGQWAQPAVIPSPDGRRLLMLLRENTGTRNALYSVSDDGARTWAAPRELPLALTGHRHHARYAGGGRLVVVMRDTARDRTAGSGWISPTYGHFVAWVGTFDDIVEGREGQYRIKLLHSHAGSDCGYSGLEVLPDGTCLATTYVKYAPGPEKHSVVCTRFKLEETDRLLAAGIGILDAGWEAPVPALAAAKGREDRFAAMTPAERRAHEVDLMRRLADLALEPPVLNTDPLPRYDYDQLDYGMNIGVERTPGGRLWAAWVAGGDSPKAFMVAATSDDNGETWSKPRLVIDSQSPALPIPRSVIVGTLWTDPLGRLWFFFDQVMNHFDGRGGLWAARCDNPDADSPAWTPPRRIWHGSMLNKPVVLATGEWMLPVQLLEHSKGIGPFAGVFPELDPYRGANVFVSTDQGETWQRRGCARFPNPDWYEHMLVERRDGTLWMLARTRTGIMQSTSADGGRTWAEPSAPAGIRQPVARFHLRRLASGRILMVKHGETMDELTTRQRITAFLSEDDGLTWIGGLMLDGRNGISYPDGTQAPDGTLFITYDRERAKLGEILMARIAEADILAGRLVSPTARLGMLVSRPLKPRER